MTCPAPAGFFYRDQTLSTEQQRPELNEDQRRVCDGLAEQILDHLDEVKRLEDEFSTLPSARIGVLIGPAGTGKTFTIADLVILLSGKGLNILVVAPTNRAVSVIQQKIKERAGSSVLSAEFRSLHSALGMRMTENDDGTQSVTRAGDPVVNDYDLVVCDEGSMVDGMLLQLMCESATRPFILGVGDDCQLLPVTGGNDRSPFFSRPHPDLIWTLSKPERYSGALAAAAGWMRDYIHGDARIDPLDVVARIPGSQIHGSKRMIELLIEQRKAGHDARALCYRNATVLNINETVHEALYGANTERFCPGEQCIVQDACTGINLATGDDYDLVTSEEAVIEVVERRMHPLYPTEECYRLVLATQNGRRVEIYSAVNPALNQRRIRLAFEKTRELKDERDRYRRGTSQYYELDAEYRESLSETWDFVKAFANIRHVYAMTTHKSQGGTFDYAYLFLDDMAGYKSAPLYNTALYTALTRPRHTAYLCFGK